MTEEFGGNCMLPWKEANWNRTPLGCACLHADLHNSSVPSENSFKVDSSSCRWSWAIRKGTKRAKHRSGYVIHVKVLIIGEHCDDGYGDYYDYDVDYVDGCDDDYGDIHGNPPFYFLFRAFTLNPMELLQTTLWAKQETIHLHTGFQR